MKPNRDLHARRHARSPVPEMAGLRPHFCQRSRLRTLGALLLAAALSSTALAADILYQTSFETPAFNAGLPIRGQDNWEMFHDGEALSISTGNARTGAQCLRFDGALLEQIGPNHTSAYCFSRALEALSNSPPAIVEISASVRLDGPQTGTMGTPEQDILSANFMAVVPQADGQGQLLGGFFVSSAGRIFTYSRVPEDSYKFSLPYTLGTYRDLTLRVDFIARRMTWLVDGEELGSGTFAPTIPAERLLSSYLYLNGALEPVNTPELAYDRGNYTAFFDDYNLVSMPLGPVNAVIEFVASTVLADEFKPAARINLLRRGFTNAAVRVVVNTANGTAIAGEDYEAVSTYVRFAAGETNKLLEVRLKDDAFAEPDRTFTAHISDLPPGATSGKPQASVLIRDDERPGSVDLSWASDYGLPPLRSNEVKYAVPTVFPFPVQEDGKLIASISIEGPNVAQVFRVARLNTDGSLDTSFPPIQRTRWITGWPTPSGKVVLLEEDPPRGSRISRRNADGTLDMTFIGTITNRGISGVKGLPDGRTYVYGDFIGVDGNPPRTLLRLNDDGTRDSTFSATITITEPLVWPLISRKVLVTRRSANRNDVGVWLLNENGSLDTNFNVGSGLGANGTTPSEINAVIEQADGRIVLAGYFKNFNGRLCNSIARLNTDGSFDETFATGQGFTFRESTGIQYPGYISIHALSNGGILVSQDLDGFNGEPVTGPIILNTDGSRMRSFEGTIPDGRTYVERNYVVAVIDDQAIFFHDYGLGRLRMNLPLRIVSHARDGHGTNRVIANALVGHTYKLQSSENLTNWTDLTTQPATTNRIEFTDTPAANTVRRFYRVEQR